MNEEQRIDVTFTTLNDLMIKHDIVPDTKQDLEVMESLISKRKFLTKQGWIPKYESNDPPTIRAAIFASTERDIPEKINVYQLLQEMNL